MEVPGSPSIGPLNLAWYRPNLNVNFVEKSLIGISTLLGIAATYSNFALKSYPRLTFRVTLSFVVSSAVTCLLEGYLYRKESNQRAAEKEKARQVEEAEKLLVKELTENKLTFNEFKRIHQLNCLKKNGLPSDSQVPSLLRAKFLELTCKELVDPSREEDCELLKIEKETIKKTLEERWKNKSFEELFTSDELAFRESIETNFIGKDRPFIQSLVLNYYKRHVDKVCSLEVTREMEFIEKLDLMPPQLKELFNSAIKTANQNKTDYQNKLKKLEKSCLQEIREAEKLKALTPAKQTALDKIEADYKQAANKYERSSNASERALAKLTTYNGLIQLEKSVVDTKKRVNELSDITTKSHEQELELKQLTTKLKEENEAIASAKSFLKNAKLEDLQVIVKQYETEISQLYLEIQRHDKAKNELLEK